MAPLTVILVVVVLVVGWIFARSAPSRALLALLTFLVASWAVMLRFSIGMPALLSLAIVILQSSTLAVLYTGDGPPAGYWQTWQGGLTRGLATANLFFWGAQCLRWTLSHSRIRLLGGAAILAIVGGTCVAQVRLIASVHAASFIAGCCGTAGGLALLGFVGKERNGMRRGWYETRYFTSI